MDNQLTKLTELFRKLPGIGPRQSRRLSFWIVQQNVSYIDELSRTLKQAQKQISICDSCKRIFPKATSNLCSICTSGARDTSMLLLVEKDVDLENIEKIGAYSGMYFVLGGTTSPLDKDQSKMIRIRELLEKLNENKDVIKEIIYALSATTEGEDTITYIDAQINDLVKKQNIRVTKLGRGLSTGTELEYVDRDTMSYALKGRN